MKFLLALCLHQLSMVYAMDQMQVPGDLSGNRYSTHDISNEGKGHFLLVCYKPAAFHCNTLRMRRKVRNYKGINACFQRCENPRKWPTDTNTIHFMLQEIRTLKLKRKREKSKNRSQSIENRATKEKESFWTCTTYL